MPEHGTGCCQAGTSCFEALQHLKRPTILEVKGVIAECLNPFLPLLVLEFCPHGDLHTLLHEDGPASLFVNCLWHAGGDFLDGLASKGCCQPHNLLLGCVLACAVCRPPGDQPLLLARRTHSRPGLGQPLGPP